MWKDPAKYYSLSLGHGLCKSGEGELVGNHACKPFSLLLTVSGMRLSEVPDTFTFFPRLLFFGGGVGGREGQGVISRQQEWREDRGVENSMVLVGNPGHTRTQDVYFAWEFNWVNFRTFELYLNKVLFLLNVDSVGTLEMSSTQWATESYVKLPYFLHDDTTLTGGSWQNRSALQTCLQSEAIPTNYV